MIRRMEPTVRIPSAAPSHVRVPPELEGLRRLAYNLYWTWHPQAARRSSPGSTAAPGRAPTARSRSCRAWSTGRRCSTTPTSWPRPTGSSATSTATWPTAPTTGSTAGTPSELEGPIAYFCAEYGLHESLGIYSGGLGVLAGDHMKAASDMALPLVGVGLLYRNGYFRQTIDADGHQEHRYPDYDLSRLPLTRALGREGDPLTRHGRAARARRARSTSGPSQVGRVPVLLLDTDNPDNDPADRPITHILYVRGREMRLHQELVLGVGGVRALRALGIEPGGLAPQRGPLGVPARRAGARAGRRGRRRSTTALATVARNSVFTIHTPVSAGNERFDADLVRRVAGPLLDGDGRPNTGGVPVERVLEIGRGHGRRPEPVRHDRLQPAADQRRQRRQQAPRRDRQRARGRASRRTAILGDHQRRPPADVGRRPDPRAVRALPRRRPRRPRRRDRRDAAGGSASTASRRPSCGRRTSGQKRELAVFARGRLRNQFARHGEAPRALQELGEALDPDVLTIGFARRFATYKRAGMIFTDAERLARLLVERGPAGPARLRRQGPSRRPAGPGGDPGDLRADALAGVPRPGLHPRGLRHADRPASWSRASTSG